MAWIQACSVSSWKTNWSYRVPMTAGVVILILIVVVSFHCVSRVDCFNRNYDGVTDNIDDSETVPRNVNHRPLSATTINRTRLHVSRQSKDERQQAEWALLARENVLQMRSDSIRCATPRPRVIKVQDVHPHASKRFVPSCVVLYRCDRESGCCDDVDSVCSALKKRRVAAHFYVVSLGEHNGVPSVEVHGRVERLRFTNHTECGCRKRRRSSPNSVEDIKPDERAVKGAGATLSQMGLIAECGHIVIIVMAMKFYSQR